MSKNPIFPDDCQEFKALLETSLAEADFSRIMSEKEAGLKESGGNIQATLDLHGKTRSEVAELVIKFILAHRRRIEATILIITGRGNHSPKGPVLPNEVESLLRRLKRKGVKPVQSYQRVNGNGAFLVKLKPKG